MFGDDDLSLFFDANEGGTACTRIRAGEFDLPFTGNFGAEGDDGFDGHAQDVQRRLQFPTACDVRRGDMVVIGALQFGVERVDPLNDGAESTAILLPRGPAA